MSTPAADARRDRHQPVITTLAAEQCARLYQNTLLGILLSLIFSLILSASHWQSVGTAEIITWNLILYFTLSVRFILWVSWRLAAPVLPSKWWLNFGRLGVWLTGLSWGISTYYLFSYAEEAQQTLFAFALAGVVGCSIPLLSTDKYAAVGYILLSVMPLTIMLLLEENHASLYMTMMTLTFIVFTIRKSAMDEKQLREHFFVKRKLLRTTQAHQDDLHIHQLLHQSFQPFFKDYDATALIKRLLDNYCQFYQFQFAVILPYGELTHAVTANNHASELVLGMLENGSLDYRLEPQSNDIIYNDLTHVGIDHHAKAISNYALFWLTPATPEGAAHLLIAGNKPDPIHRRDISPDAHLLAPISANLTHLFTQSPPTQPHHKFNAD